MSFVERFIIHVQCPYFGGSTIGGSTVVIWYWKRTLQHSGSNGQLCENSFFAANLVLGGDGENHFVGSMLEGKILLMDTHTP